jgi:pimeloyl-ACP methyl ester carboxylesterase
MEKINIWRGKSRSGISVLWANMLNTDMVVKVPELKLPVYFFVGIYDYTVSYTLAKDYFEKLKAPVKGFYTFEKSAHSPLFEESQKMRQIIRDDVLTGKNGSSDIVSDL